jgi:kynurenine formamidase
VRIIDLSVTLENDSHWAPWWARNRVSYQNHAVGAWVIWLLFGLPKRLLRGQQGWANETIRLSTHGTTHLDAPWHYGPTTGGQPAKTIDQIPLEWCYGPGVVLDLTHKLHGEAISVADVEAALQRIGHTLSSGEIVLIRTGNDARLGSPEYFTHGSGMSAEATRWLIDRGIRVMGIDSWGWDRPLPVQTAEAKKSQRADLFWEAHYVGVDLEYCHLERLTNLGSLPSTGFRVCCFPLKVKGGSAGPCRVVGIVEA